MAVGPDGLGFKFIPATWQLDDPGQATRFLRASVFSPTKCSFQHPRPTGIAVRSRIWKLPTQSLVPSRL